MNPPSRNFDVLIFDLDGTLLDSLADIANAANEVLQQHGHPPHELAAYRHLVGDGVRVLFERALPSVWQQDSKLLDICVADFKTVYDRHWDRTSQPYAGIMELLGELVARQLKLAVLSNKPHMFTTACVDRFFGQTAWAKVLGNLPDVPRKPDPAGVHQILSELNSEPARCLYVGDTNTDMLTAIAAGCRAIGVTWGFRSPQELSDSGAAQLIDHPRQLLDCLS